MLVKIPFCCHYISLSSGGGFKTWSNSTRGLQNSWALGLYVPLVALLLLATFTNITNPMARPINTISTKGTATYSMLKPPSPALAASCKKKVQNQLQYTKYMVEKNLVKKERKLISINNMLSHILHLVRE